MKIGKTSNSKAVRRVQLSGQKRTARIDNSTHFKQICRRQQLLYVGHVYHYGRIIAEFNEAFHGRRVKSLDGDHALLALSHVAREHRTEVGATGREDDPVGVDR